MSQSGLQLRTNYLVPFFQSNSRTEFRVDSADKVILSNMRLCDFGVTLAGAANYAVTAGVYSLIKNIYLYSGSVLIDQMRDCSKYMAIKNMRGSTADIYDLNQQLLCSNNVLDGDQVAQFEALTNKLIGRVPLSQIFGLLRATETLNSWDTLRLVIEYNTNPQDIFILQGGARPAAGAWTVSTPLLAYDELVVDEAGRDAMMKQGKAVMLTFPQIERERWYVPQNTAYYSQRLRAFDDKTLSKVIVQTFDPATVDDYLCKNYSQAMLGEKIQLNVNGKKLLPFQGAFLQNQKTAMFHDSFGQHICFTGENTSVNVNGDVDAVYGDAQSRDMLSKLAFFGCDVLNKITYLDIEYSRDTTVAGQDTELENWIFGEVSMYCKKDASGKLSVGYV
jgi:hypothetical protein